MIVKGIIRHDKGFAVLTGNNLLNYKPTLMEAIRLLQCWKNRGIITAGDIDSLFRDDKIEFYCVVVVNWGETIQVFGLYGKYLCIFWHIG